MFYPELNKYTKVFDLPNEVWKDVIGHENSYQISDLGRVRTKTRLVPRKVGGGSQLITKRSVVKVIHNYSKGYPSVQLSKNGKQITISNILTGYSWSTVTGIPKKQRKFKHRQQPMKD